jgi:hypothetical protein
VRDIRSCLDTLASLAHPDGGWGYAPGQPAHLEPTCLGLLALSLDAGRFGPLLEAGRAGLARCTGGRRRRRSWRCAAAPRTPPRPWRSTTST